MEWNSSNKIIVRRVIRETGSFLAQLSAPKTSQVWNISSLNNEKMYAVHTRNEIETH